MFYLPHRHLGLNISFWAWTLTGLELNQSIIPINLQKTKSEENGSTSAYYIHTKMVACVALTSNQSHEVTDHITIATDQEEQLVDDSI